MEEATHFELGWKTSEWGRDAQKMRNRRARELRKEGYTVDTRTLDFTDLARDSVALLEAHMPGTPREMFGAPTSYVHPVRKED